VADSRQRFSWRCSGSAGSDSSPVFLYGALDLEFADMTQEDNMRFARKAGFVEYELEDYTPSGYDIRYERFAELVRADEREACAKLAENRSLTDENKNKRIGHNHACKSIAIDIRARGQA